MQPAGVHVIHLGIAREQAERATFRYGQQLANPLRRLARKIRLSRIRHIRRHVEHRLRFVIEMRRHNQLACIAQSQPPARVGKSAAHRNRRRSQHRRMQIRKQRRLQNC